MGCCWSCGCYCTDRRVKGQVCIVTGGNQGVGYWTAKGLVQKGMHVILACRSKEKGEEAVKKLKESHKKATVDFIPLDLASLESVREFVKEFKSRNLPLHCLINNAGIMACPFDKSKDGYEMQFAVNHLGHFLLTTLLMDALEASAPSRIITVTSVAHLDGGGVPMDRLPTYNDGNNYTAWGAYGTSKSCNIMFTYELQRRLKGTGVSAVTVHPGVIRSNLWQHNSEMGWAIPKCPPDGATPSIYLASTPSVMAHKMEKDSKDEDIKEYEGINRFFVPRCCCAGPAVSSEVTYKRAIQRALWTKSLEWAMITDTDNLPKYLTDQEEPLEEEKDYKPSAMEMGWASIGMCPCCWCCC